MTIGSRIKGSRLAKDLTNASEFSRRAKVSRQYLANLENDKSDKPDPNYLRNIAKELDVSLDWLISGEGNPARERALSAKETELLAALGSLSDEHIALVLGFAKALQGKK